MRFLPILLLVSSLALAHPPAPAAPKAPPSLEELAHLYRDFGLPLPPDDAPLVQTPVGRFQTLQSGRALSLCTLGFLLKPAGEHNDAVVLVGPRRYVCDVAHRYGRTTLVRPDHVSLEEFFFDFGDDELSPFAFDSSLATAIQCHVRGYEKLAQVLYQKALQLRDPGHGPIAVSSGRAWIRHRGALNYEGAPGDEARTILAGSAWNYWMNELERAGSDRQAAAAAMKKILAAAPTLAIASRKDLLHSLDAALAPSHARPGSIEADLDGLVDCEMAGFALGALAGDSPDARYHRVLLRGFDTIPALIAHLGDRRLTRSIVQRFNNFPTMPRCVNEIASDLLEAIAAEHLSRDPLGSQLGIVVGKSAAEKWWAKAKRIGEESYLRAHVFPQDPDANALNTGPLAIIEARYPQDLPGIYRELLEKRNTLQSEEVAAAISRSALSNEEKRASLLRASADRALQHRLPAIRELRKFDAAAADAAVLDVLRNLPKKTSAPVWLAAEAQAGRDAAESLAPEVWDALTAAAKRSDVSLRLELLERMSYWDLEAPQWTRMLRFFAQFLNDETVRDSAASKELYAGPCAAFTFPRITVRDFVAMEINGLLNFSEEPELDWTAKQWTALRAAAAQAVAWQTQ